MNPEIDEVEKHLIFLPNGNIQGLTKKGQETISLLDLNRDRLVFYRKKVLDTVTNEIKDILEDYVSSETNHDQCRYALHKAFTKISHLQNPKNPYSRFGYFIFTKFEIFVANQLGEKQKNAVLILFKQFLQGKL